MDEKTLRDISNYFRGLAIGKTFSRKAKALGDNYATDPSDSSEPDDMVLAETDGGTPSVHAVKRDRKIEGYRRKVPLPKDKQEDANRRHFLTEMKAHFNEVDAFELAVESPAACAFATEQRSCHREVTSEQENSPLPVLGFPEAQLSFRQDGQDQPLPDLLRAKGALPSTSQPEGELGQNLSPLSPDNSQIGGLDANAAAQHIGESNEIFPGFWDPHKEKLHGEPADRAPQFPQPSPFRQQPVSAASATRSTAGRAPRLGLSRRSSAIFAVSPQRTGRQSLLEMHRQPRQSHLASRPSVPGLAEDDTFAKMKAQPSAYSARHLSLPAEPDSHILQPAKEFSPIAESPEAVDKPPERIPDSAQIEALPGILDKRLGWEDQAKAIETPRNDSAAGLGFNDQLSSLQQLLRICSQSTCLEDIPSMEELIRQHAKLNYVKKIGEGTFGEAFKAGHKVFKIVPLDGDLLVNGEIQKTSQEIFAEAAISSTLSRLREKEGDDLKGNITSGFVELHGLGICKGRYAPALVKEWHSWDKRVGSENDPVDAFPSDQLYVVYVVADGGIDLEKFEPRSFAEAQSILLQCALSLAVAEEACEYEHRDLHWGNILISRQPMVHVQFRLRGVDLEAKAEGLLITLIDFTLSRIRLMSGESAYSDLNADPALFKGPKGDCQSETYRRMKKANKGDWQSFTPASNTLWMHYLADVLLNRKLGSFSPAQKHELRSFRKRCMTSKSCVDLITDSFFGGLWHTLS